MRVVAVDHWLGSSEHQRGPWKKDLPKLYDTFLGNCWPYRDRLVPLRESTIAGMNLVYQASIEPSLVYVDAAHDFASVVGDIRSAMALFPEAIITGDDFPHPPVQRAVKQVREEHGCKLRVKGRCWAFGA